MSNGGRYARVRFTPTGVGKISDNVLVPKNQSVHPHGCGENSGGNCDDSGIFGSPPRVWGKYSCLTTTIFCGQLYVILPFVWDLYELQTIVIDDFSPGIAAHAHFKTLLGIG